MHRAFNLTALLFVSCFLNVLFAQTSQGVYHDAPFWQDSAEKFGLSEGLTERLWQVRCDRNGTIQVLSDAGLLLPDRDKLVRSHLYRPLADMKVAAIEEHQSEFVYLTDKAVLSNAWAGTFHLPTNLPDAKVFAIGKDFSALVSGADGLVFFSQGKVVWIGKPPQMPVLQIRFDDLQDRFLLLMPNQLASFAPASQQLKVEFEGVDFTCMELTNGARTLIIGTKDGYLKLDAQSYHEIAGVEKKLPCTEITVVEEIDGKVWFGSKRGAFTQRSEGGFDYYSPQRWLLDDEVVDMAKGPAGSVLILTRKGLSRINFEQMTLAQKAVHFDKMVRQRHIRYGLNCDFALAQAGNLASGTLIDSDNDGLWTSMYLAGELFRFAVTKSEEARQNCIESFVAMERLDYINPLKGFPSRTFERRGYKMSDTTRWRPTEDQLWDWKATTSSDEIVGHFFVYSLFAELIDDATWRNRAISLMDGVMDHIVRNNWYLIDYDGKPTQWGRWHPEYVNKFPKEVGDRRLNSVEIIAFLQTTFHFTGKEIYKKKALELMKKHGYLDNIMIPIFEIGHVPGIDLSTDWNHSDDELAFLSYWNLYRFAFSDELKDKYRQTIQGHWQLERPEKNPLWNFIYAMTGVKEFDLDKSIWSLQQMPMDLITWPVRNSHRKDLDFIPANFRNQTITKVLPPDERPVSKYNNNAFSLDAHDNGHAEQSGDIFLMPYWMGRYLGLIK